MNIITVIALIWLGGFLIGYVVGSATNKNKK